jgi:hypothetical protein
LQWTEAQKKDLSNHPQGQVLLFHRSSHGIAPNEALVIERSDKSHIIARDLNGVERMVSPTQARSFSVHERSQIEISPGDRLLLTGNRRKLISAPRTENWPKSAVSKEAASTEYRAANSVE